MSQQFPPKYMIGRENFAISARLCLNKRLPVKKFFGFVSGNASLHFAEIPEDAYAYELPQSATYAYVGFIDSQEGSKLFTDYLVALSGFVKKYKLVANAELLRLVLKWDLDIWVEDRSATEGYREITCFDGRYSLMTSLENTIAILRRTPHSKALIVLCDERENGEGIRNSENDNQYMSCGEYTAIDGDVVKIHFCDFNDDDFEGVHQVELNKRALADALQRVHTQLTKQLEQICKAINIDYKTANQLLNEYYKA